MENMKVIGEPWHVCFQKIWARERKWIAATNKER